MKKTVGISSINCKNINTSRLTIGRLLRQQYHFISGTLTRGYGGIAVLWNKNIDHRDLVKILPDESEKNPMYRAGG